MDGFAFGRPPEPDRDALLWLTTRLGPDLAERRIRRERVKEAKAARPAVRKVFSFWSIVDATLPSVLMATGLLGRGRANAARLTITRNEVAIRGLPEALRGYTLLHLSDLHADISQNAIRALPKALEALSYDACIITGDFRGRTFGPYGHAVELVREAVSALGAPILGILGNHDPAGIGPHLEAIGIRLLMNEAVPVERDGARLWIAGVDDPHYYRTDDVAAAMASVPAGEPAVLLAHSTEPYEAAAAAGVGLMLCGHTHGGQLCLPGSVPVFTSSGMPRWLASGAWRHGSMQGYTSKGIGTSSVDARFNCPPEIALHTLVPQDD